MKPIQNYISAQLGELLHFFKFMGEVIVAFFPPYARPQTYYRQFVVIGLKSIPIVLVVGAFVGMVLAVMTYRQFSKLGIESLMGPFIALPMVSQLGPIMTSLMILCRVGSSMTAEIGTMRVTEQIDALSCFGVNPIRNLIVPRIVICTLMLPCLTVISDSIGILGGYIVSIHIYEVEEHFYMLQTQKYFSEYDIYTGLINTFMFGIIISCVCCFKGYFTQGGASGVGKSIMESVVVSFVIIIVVNFLMTLLTTKLWEVLNA